MTAETGVEHRVNHGQTFSALVTNIARDAVSAAKAWHFVKLLGRDASQVTLDCAIQMHPNVALIGEEMQSENLLLHDTTQRMCDTIEKQMYYVILKLNLPVIVAMSKPLYCIAAIRIPPAQRAFACLILFEVLSVLPLCSRWISCLSLGRNLAAVGSIEESVEIYDMDVIDGLSPILSVGGRVATAQVSKRRLNEALQDKDGVPAQVTANRIKNAMVLAATLYLVVLDLDMPVAMATAV